MIERAQLPTPRRCWRENSGQTVRIQGDVAASVGIRCEDRMYVNVEGMAARRRPCLLLLEGAVHASPRSRA